MKNLVKWLFPIILCTLPVLGKGGLPLSDAEFLDNPTIKTCQILEVHEDESSGEPKLFAKVEVESTTGEKEERVVPALFVGADWEHDDAKKISKRIVEAYVMCKGKKVSMDYTRAERFRYQPAQSIKKMMLNGKEIQDKDMPLGMKVSVAEQAEHKRKDGSIYKDIGASQEIIAHVTYQGHLMDAKLFMESNPVGTKAEVVKYSVANDLPKDKLETLYEVVIREKTDPFFYYDTCREHGQERSFKGTSMRHAYDVYKAVPTTRTLNKIAPNGDETPIITGPQEMLLTLDSQEKLGAGHKNRPVCTTLLAGKFPPGYRLADKPK